MSATPEHAEPAPPGRNRRTSGEIVPGGRRTLTLTLDQVAEILQVDVRKVRMLLRLQAKEDSLAESEERAPRRVGLRGLYLSERLTRVSEEELGNFLRGGRDIRDQ